jgi:dipeptidyl aminopeptidase/acylaminoacyl peptidase
VARGYGVLQPQFRGSSGYGASFQQAGYRQWGGKMQDDVTDATRWLIERKLADPARICLFGLSYGGYAALMGAATQPELYQCAAAWAPVTDLADLLQDRDHNEFGWLNRDRMVGEQGVRPRQSPIDLAADVTLPVLLMHGREDYTVPVRHSLEMEARLLSAHRPVSALYLDQADHFLSRGSDRIAVLRALDGFLSDHLGAGRPLSPS